MTQASAGARAETYEGNGPRRETRWSLTRSSSEASGVPSGSAATGRARAAARARTAGGDLGVGKHASRSESCVELAERAAGPRRSDAGRDAARRVPPAQVALDRLADIEQLLGASSVSTATHAFKKSG